MRYPWPVAGPGRATRGRPTLQTSSNHHDLNRLTKTPVTNVVNLSPKTTIISEKALRLTTFVTTDQKSTQKTPWIDDVCNNTPPATLQRHSAAGVEGAGGTGGPDCGARGRRRSLAGRPVGGRRYKRQHTRSHWCGGRRRDRRARLQCPWAAAGPGRTTSRRTEPHVSTPGPTGVEGAGGSGGHGRASRSTTPSRRLACGDLAGGRARRRPEHQRSHKQQHTARTARGRAAAHRHTQRPSPPAPETPVGPQHNETRPRPVARPRPRHAHAAPFTTAPPAIRRSCPRDPRPRRGQPRGGQRGRGTGSRTRSRHPRCGRSGSTAGRHRARHTRRA